jgi:hypothetical protein
MTNAMIDAGSDPRIDDTAAPKGSAGQLVLVPETLERLGADIEAPQSDGRELIVIDDERLIREGEAAVERFKMSREQILPMARGLAAAKRKYPATREFGAWLESSRYSSLCAQDRAAMVKIGKHFDAHETAIVKFLAATKLTSPQSIWTAMAAKLGLGAEVADDCSDAIDAVDIVTEPERRSPTVDSSFYLSNSPDVLRDGGPSSEQARASSASRKAAAPTIEAPDGPEDPWASGERFDLVLVSPSADDVRHLRTAQPDWLKHCLPLQRVIDKDVAVVVDTTIRDLPVIADVLLPLFGFTPGNRPRVLMVRPPESPDVTDTRILVAIESGVDFTGLEGWPDDAELVDLAARLYPDVSRTLLVFGSTERDGWQCRTWAEPPSVR